MRNYLYILFSIFMAVLFITCHKSDDDFSGDGYIRGRLFLSDAVFGTKSNEPTGNAEIKIRYASEATNLNYLYTVRTDSAGYFAFTNLQAGTSYHLFFQQKVGDQWFAADTTVAPTLDKLQFIGNINFDNQTGLLVKVLDVNKQPFTNAQVCVFNNLQYYNADSCANNIGSKKTDANGIAAFYGLVSAQYLIHIRAYVNGQLFTLDVSAPPTGNKLSIVTGTLLQTSSFLDNSISFHTKDENGGILPFVKVCLFNNQTLFLAKTCDGSINSLTTSADGSGKFSNLAPATYYLYATVKYGNLSYTKEDQPPVTLGVTDKQNIDIVLKK